MKYICKKCKKEYTLPQGDFFIDKKLNCECGNLSSKFKVKKERGNLMGIKIKGLIKYVLAIVFGMFIFSVGVKDQIESAQIKNLELTAKVDSLETLTKNPKVIELSSAIATLSTLSPVEATSILTSLGWDCLPFPEKRHVWKFTPPTTGSIPVKYKVAFAGTSYVNIPEFYMWVPGDFSYSLKEAGIDQEGREGTWSVPTETTR